jgi:hypothetical protein
MLRFSSAAAAVLIGLLTAAITAGPVAAAFDWGQTGRTGPRLIADSLSESSVRCDYGTVGVQESPDEWYRWQGKLTRLDVRPPQMWSIAGTQRVGWRFIVQRAKKPTSTFNDPWFTTYRSAIQTATATQVDSAAFTPMHVKVAVPKGTLERNHAYRVMLKLFWYRANGTVQGTAKYLLSYYETYFLEHVEGISPPWCDARIAYWLPD